jgi:hypothetical protein
MEVDEIGRQLVRESLKPPVQLLAVSPGTLPKEAGIKYEKTFDSVDDAYAFFRQERPEGRWTLWLRGSDGQMMGIDSQRWEKKA